MFGKSMMKTKYSFLKKSTKNNKWNRASGFFLIVPFNDNPFKHDCKMRKRNSQTVRLQFSSDELLKNFYLTKQTPFLKLNGELVYVE
jgi:hypothetical protein